MKFRPLHDRVLIEVLDSSEKTAGGIIIPDTAQEKPQEGKVVAIGGGALLRDLDKLISIFSLLSKTSIKTLSCNGLNFINSPL